MKLRKWNWRGLATRLTVFGAALGGVVAYLPDGKVKHIAMIIVSAASLIEGWAAEPKKEGGTEDGPDAE